MFLATVCKTTSTKRANRAHCRGFTLAELVVASGLGSLLLVVIAAVTFYSARSFVAMANYVDLENDSRNALDTMTREIRQADSLTSYTTNSLVFRDFDSNELRYVYDPTAKTLSRVKGSQTQVLLSECDQLSFSIFQRNPIGGSYDQYPTATPATAKLIQLNWKCSRTIFNTQANTESVQSAKIVIRKQ
jgi:prepilin-type N-terminal cleavage/methylation domain-containing protein